MNSIVCLSLFCLFSLGLSISLFIYLSIYLSVDIYLSTSTDRDKTFMPNSAVPLGACVCVCSYQHGLYFTRSARKFPHSRRLLVWGRFYLC